MGNGYRPEYIAYIGGYMEGIRGIDYKSNTSKYMGKRKGVSFLEGNLAGLKYAKENHILIPKDEDKAETGIEPEID